MAAISSRYSSDVTLSADLFIQPDLTDIISLFPVSLTDSVGNTSVSTTTDNERQLFIEQSVGMPPPYNFNKLSSGGFEDQLPYPPSFATAGSDLGSGHYLAGMSPTDDTFYSANK